MEKTHQKPACDRRSNNGGCWHVSSWQSPTQAQAGRPSAQRPEAQGRAKTLCAEAVAQQIFSGQEPAFEAVSRAFAEVRTV